MLLAVSRIFSQALFRMVPFRTVTSSAFKAAITNQTLKRSELREIENALLELIQATRTINGFLDHQIVLNESDLERILSRVDVPTQEQPAQKETRPRLISTQTPRRRRTTSSWKNLKALSLADTAGFVDPVTYKVARRLLQKGEDIQTVARKLWVAEAPVRRLAIRLNESKRPRREYQPEKVAAPIRTIELEEPAVVLTPKKPQVHKVERQTKAQPNAIERFQVLL